MDEFEIEIKQDFLIESEDLFEAAESAFLRLEGERDNPELLNEIFRLAHNLKGTAMAVGFTQLADFTHIAENLILKLKD
jgi:two-component system chemotaxis sensor kinase CheA